MRSIVTVIPLYNGLRWINGALRSVLAQTRMPDDVIVVDDGSTDGGTGAAIVEALRQQFPVIRLLRKANGGQAAARNFAIRHSHCDLIALLDQDDCWYPNHLERLLRPFNRVNRGSGMPIGWSYSNMDEIDESGRCIRHSILDGHASRHPKRSLVQCLRQDMFVLPSASLISREAFDAVAGFDERLCGYEDDDFFLRVFCAGFDNVYVNERLSQWRLYPSSTSYSNRMAVSRMIYADKQIAAFPDQPAQGLYYVRDLIAPRFLTLLKGEHERLRKQGDIVASDKRRDEIIEIAAHLPKNTQMRVRVFLSLAGVRFNFKVHLPAWMAIWMMVNSRKSRLA